MRRVGGEPLARAQLVRCGRVIVRDAVAAAYHAATLAPEQFRVLPAGGVRRALRDAALLLALRLVSLDDDTAPRDELTRAALHSDTTQQYVADGTPTGEELAAICAIAAKAALGIDAALRDSRHLERGARRRFRVAKLGMHVLLEVSRHQYGCLMLLRCFAQHSFTPALAGGVAMPPATERAAAATMLATRAVGDNDARFVVDELGALVARLAAAAQRVPGAPSASDTLWRLHVATSLLGSRQAVGKVMPLLGASDHMQALVFWLRQRATLAIMYVPALSSPAALATRHRAARSAVARDDVQRLSAATRLVDDDFMPADGVAGARPDHNPLVAGLPPAASLANDALELVELALPISFRDRTRVDVQRQSAQLEQQRVNDRKVRSDAARRAAAVDKRNKSTHVDKF
jgi:hypothetical protein